MSNLFRVRWTLRSQDEPRPWINCGRRGAPRPHRSSGKFRLNANGKRLDAWLIYKCTTCDHTWNRPIVERRLAADIPAADLAALRGGDPALARRIAADVDGLRRQTCRIDLADTVDIVRQVLATADGWTRLSIEFALDTPVGARLDRLLATGLGLGRGRLTAMAEAGRLAVEGGDLRRRPRPGTRVLIEVADPAERQALGRAAAEAAAPPAQADIAG